MRANALVSAGAEMTMISSSPFHYYSGMAPGMISGLYSKEECRVDLRRLSAAKGVKFVEDDFYKVDPINKIVHLASGSTLSYDLISFNTGSRVPSELIDETGDALTAKPFENLLRLKEIITASSGDNHLKVAVVGGGPTAVGIAGAVFSLAKKGGSNISLTLVEERGRILSSMPKRAEKIAAKSLEDRGGFLLTKYKVSKIGVGAIESFNRESIPYDIVVIGTGLVPHQHFGRSGLKCGPDGGMLVNEFLQSVDYPEIFGGGDCISIRGKALPKVGVFAVREGPFILRNMKALLAGGALKAFKPQWRYLQIINLGDGRGVAVWGRYVFAGKVAMLIKEFIDKRFMRRFLV